MVSSSLKAGEFLENWLAECVKGSVSNRTLQRYRGNVDRNLIPRLGSYPLRRPTAIHVQQMESALLQGVGRNGKPLSFGTVLQAHRVLSKAMKDAVRLRLVPRNVAEDVKPPTPKKYEAWTLSWDEVHVFLDRIIDPLYQALAGRLRNA